MTEQTSCIIFVPTPYCYGERARGWGLIFLADRLLKTTQMFHFSPHTCAKLSVAMVLCGHNRLCPLVGRVIVLLIFLAAGDSYLETIPTFAAITANRLRGKCWRKVAYCRCRRRRQRRQWCQIPASTHLSNQTPTPSTIFPPFPESNRRPLCLRVLVSLRWHVSRFPLHKSHISAALLVLPAVHRRDNL
jgi:hypothetical protein